MDILLPIEENWKEFVTRLLSIERTGIKELIEYLDKETDFKTAPASTRFHLSTPGGLCRHSLNTADYAIKLNDMIQGDFDRDSLILSALLHDLCKVNYYGIKEVWDKEYKEKTNQWRKKNEFCVDDQNPLGHGEKSCIVASSFLKLKPEEMQAIRWHMAFSDGSVHLNSYSSSSFKQAWDKTPLVKLIAMADQLAEMDEVRHPPMGTLL